MLWNHECFNDNTEGKVKKGLNWWSEFIFWNKKTCKLEETFGVNPLPFLSECLFFWTKKNLEFFSDTYLPLPPTTYFLVSNERNGKNKTFLLQCYGIDFAPIKRYRQFCSQAYMFSFQFTYLFDSLSDFHKFFGYFERTSKYG